MAILALAASPTLAQTVQGTATYRERMALPAGAVLEAVIEDVSRADAPAAMVARTRVVSPGQPPIAFTIAYDPARILADNRYAVRARILLDDQILFTSDVAVPVVTGGHPTTVSLVLRRVGAETTPGLEGTAWRLVRFQGGDDTTLGPDDPAKYAIEFGPGGRLTARIDCNRGRGTWSSKGSGHLALGHLALTRARCPAGSRP
jgi:putative lipoprotein